MYSYLSSVLIQKSVHVPVLDDIVFWTLFQLEVHERVTHEIWLAELYKYGALDESKQMTTFFLYNKKFDNNNVYCHPWNFVN